MSRLRLEGPHPVWSDTALLATLDEGTAPRPVMAFLGPEHGRSKADPAERAAAYPWIGRKVRGLLPLVEVVAIGPRNAWLYPPIDALGLSHLVDLPDSHRAPIRVSAELVAAVAETLHRLGTSAVEHNGPEPSDIAVDPQGQVHLIGFASPWPISPLFRDPAGGNEQEQLVWRLGVLLALLLGGRVPAVSDRSAHEAMTRRILIRAMSRSGPLFTERYRNWLTGMLAWEADQRPALSAIGPGLREVAESISGADLRTWARSLPERMETIRAELGEAATTVDTEASYHPWTAEGEPTEDLVAPPTPDLASMGTLPGIPLSAFERDEETAESTLLSGVMPVGHGAVEPGTMPVGIGPPVAAMKNRPSLPQGFLEGPEAEEPLPVDHGSSAQLIQLALIGLLGLISLGLLGLMGLVLWFGY